MRECMLQYIEQLKGEYDQLCVDPSLNKARIAIRNEIKSTRYILVEDRMVQTWAVSPQPTIFPMIDPTDMRIN